jgi:hypothetical protein
VEQKALTRGKVDWSLIASQLDISNGHAARMRFSRLRQHMEGVSTTPRNPRPRKNNASNKSGKLGKGCDGKVEGKDLIKQEPFAEEARTQVKEEEPEGRRDLPLPLGANTTPSAMSASYSTPLLTAAPMAPPFVKPEQGEEPSISAMISGLPDIGVSYQYPLTSFAPSDLTFQNPFLAPAPAHDPFLAPESQLYPPFWPPVKLESNETYTDDLWDTAEVDDLWQGE